MAKPEYTIEQNVSVGIYDNCQYVARIYKDKIIVISPYVKWVGNSGGYAESKEAIREQKIIDKVLAALADECATDAWQAIGKAIGNDYLAYNG